MGRLAMVVAVTFGIVSGVGLVLTLVFAPTSSPTRLVSFLAVMQAVAAATVAGVLYVALASVPPVRPGPPRPSGAEAGGQHGGEAEPAYIGLCGLHHGERPPVSEQGLPRG